MYCVTDQVVGGTGGQALLKSIFVFICILFYHLYQKHSRDASMVALLGT